MTSLTIFAMDCLIDYEMQQFLHSTWKIGPQLQRLVIKGHLCAIAAIVHEAILGSVAELTIELTDYPFGNPFTNGRLTEEELVSDSITHFIRNCAPSLRSLTLMSWASADLSPLFLGVGTLPLLRNVFIRAAFNKAFRGNPTGLRHFIVTHAEKLEEIVLRLNPTGSALDPSSEQALGNWLESLLSGGQTFPELRHLQLYPTINAVGFSALTEWIHQSKGTLRELSVRDRYLTYEEVTALLNQLTGTTRETDTNGQLTFLRLNIRSVNAPLFYLLALKLPNLTSLELYIGDTGGESLGNLVGTFSLFQGSIS
jgi:hypothetical protein